MSVVARSISWSCFACWLVVSVSMPMPMPSVASAQSPALDPREPRPDVAPHNPQPASESEPSAEVQAEYRDIVGRAVLEFDQGRVVEARALFKRAHELWPSARTLRTLGMTSFELRMYPQALDELQRALENPRRPLPEEQRAQVADLIERARAFVGIFRLQLAPATAELRVDGAPHSQSSPQLVMGVGVHDLVARAPGYSDLHREMLVHGHEDEELTLNLEPYVAPVLPPPTAAVATASPKPDLTPTPDSPDRLPPILAFGVAGVGVVVGSVAGVMAFDKKHDVDNLEAGHRAADISTAAFITAGVAAAVGTVLWVIAPSASKTDSAQQPAVSVGPHGVSGRF